MASITEDYVSFETAKLLRKKGFDEKCQKVYIHNGQLLWAQIFMEGESFVDSKCIDLVANYNDWITHTQSEYAYLGPTLQMAMKWLRRIHNINIDIVSVWNQKRFEYQVFVVTPENAKNCYVNDKLYLGHEEACEAAIKYCLEHLVK